MAQISNQLLYQRLRNRVIELCDMFACFEDCAAIGAFEAINWADDFLPLDYDDDASQVFSRDEQDIIAELVQRVDRAAKFTVENSWDVAWFEASQDWCLLSECAKRALDIFAWRGRFREDQEATL